MISKTRDAWKLVVTSKALVDDSKKEGNNFIKTGSKSLLYKYTFKNYEFMEEISFSSKSDEWMNLEGKEFYLILQVSQFGIKSPTVKLTALEPVKK